LEKFLFKATKIFIKEFAFIFPGTYLICFPLGVETLGKTFFPFFHLAFFSVSTIIAFAFKEHKAPNLKTQNTELFVINT